MIIEPIKPQVLAVRLIPNISYDLAQQLGFNTRSKIHWDAYRKYRRCYIYRVG